MKRYLVFGGECHYATGGANDFIGAFDDKQEASDFGLSKYELHHREVEYVEWYHVFDTIEQRICDKSRENPYGSD
jgi:hypothetical protein